MQGDSTHQALYFTMACLCVALNCGRFSHCLVCCIESCVEFWSVLQFIAIVNINRIRNRSPLEPIAFGHRNDSCTSWFRLSPLESHAFRAPPIASRVLLVGFPPRSEPNCNPFEPALAECTSLSIRSSPLEPNTGQRHSHIDSAVIPDIRLVHFTSLGGEQGAGKNETRSHCEGHTAHQHFRCQRKPTSTKRQPRNT
jgi:hypothetical protein